MEVKYKIVLSARLGHMLPSVAKVENELNGWMSGFGFDKKMHVRSNAIQAELTVKRALTPEEKNKVINMMLEEYTKAQPTWEVKFESFEML